jgi:citrate lyase subunit beta/citryl-CoA lyase
MAQAGQRGAAVRSDSWVELEPGGSGLRLEVTSKVESMYGEAIRAQVRADLAALGVRDAAVRLVDAGALPFTLSARLETAVRRAGLPVTRPVLPTAHVPLPGASKRDRPRRSRLYLPGNEPKFMVNAAQHGPDGVILDLEDSVAPAEKDAARVLVRNALITLDFGGCERMVRINQLPAGLDDLDVVAPHGVQLVLLPKCESAEQVRAVDARLRALVPGQVVHLMPIIESALGVFRALEIATAAPSVVGLTIGLEDYTADLGAQRTAEGRESFWARSVIVNAARAAGIQAIDTVFSDVDDEEGLRRSILEAKGLGFEGKGVIHPRQIAVVHDAFAPEPAVIERAKAIARAFDDAQARGLGVVALGSKMIDAPVVKRALTTLERAVAAGRLSPGWRDEGEVKP